MRTIAIANQKGGCGKTTTAVSLAAAFAERGCRTLLLDLDPQGHSTIGFDYDPDKLSTTIYDALVHVPIGIGSVTMSTKVEWLDLAPSNVLLSGAELDLTRVPGREFILTEKLRAVGDKYDLCIIDCPPSLGLLTLNALIASTGVVVPVQVHYYAMEGLKQLFETANIIKERYQPRFVRIMGILLTFVEDNTLLSRQIQQQMREFFGDLVFDTVIHRSVKLAEAPSAGEPVVIYAPQSKAAVEYRALADEVMNSKTWAEQTINQEVLVRR
ncbi:MAG: ParA family protein [Phycisphaerales bacterium]|nr:MAG: ParA family protein [Phycisphaerales bacterium]